jgi:formylglycine-generating enzyme required for sulfatase activity
MDTTGRREKKLPQEPAREGQRVGSYRLIRLLGQGGMGAVYEAVDEDTHGRLAIKVLGARFANDDDARTRFREEAKAAAAVRDRGLVKVFGIGKLPDETPCIMMELLEGDILRRRLAKFPKCQMPIRWTVQTTMQLAQALSAAHRHSIVHLDVKPENVMIVADAAVPGGERPILLDFGIAKLLHAPNPQTALLNKPLGTPTYMSPEQCRRSDKLDARSDVYSLGCMLYELVCGVPPFDPAAHDPNHITNQHLCGSPLAAQHHRPEIPRELRVLLERMLAKDANKRPGCDEVAARCQLILDHHPVGTHHALWLGMPLVIVAFIGIMLAFLFNSSPRDMVLLPAASFTMGSTREEVNDALRLAQGPLACPFCKLEQFERELPAQRVTLREFYLDRFETTNKQFADWLNEQHYTIEQKTIPVKEKSPGKQPSIRSVIAISDGTTRVALIDIENQALQRVRGLWVHGSKVYVVSGMEKKPVIDVTWDGANRFCQSQKKRLPTEAEWERAARGTNNRRFPWGTVLPTKQGTVLGWPDSLKALRDVGSSPQDQSPEGVYDLAGNVSEWTIDYFMVPYPACGRCLNPVQNRSPIGETPSRVVRGGSWSKEPDSARTASRGRLLSTQTSGDIGFRCARDVQGS